MLLSFPYEILLIVLSYITNNTTTTCFHRLGFQQEKKFHGISKTLLSVVLIEPLFPYSQIKKYQ